MSDSAKAFLLQADPILANIIRTNPEPVTVSSDNVFMDLVSCVVEQQIHYRSSKKIFQRTSLYGLNPNTALKKQMLDVAEGWKGHRSLAVKYVLGWKKA